MSISVKTAYGKVRVEPFVVPENDEQHGGGQTFARLTLHGTEYTARVNFDQAGNPVGDWRVPTNEDPRAFDITFAINSEMPWERRYAPPAARARLLSALSQAFAEATYTEKFQAINSYYTMKRLADLLRERTQINRQLRATLKELADIGVVNRGMTEKNLPSWFNTGEQHRGEFEGALGQMALHVRQFPLTEDQRETVDKYGDGCDQGSWMAVDEVHKQVCPLLIVKEEFTD